MQDENLKEKALFLKKFATRPRTIGSVTPSSHHLVASMFENVDWRSVRVVAELGAGTGSMTREILKKKSADTKLFVFEIEKELRARLAKETGLEIYEDAAKLPEVLAQNEVKRADLIVSSLPYAVLPRGVTASVLGGIKQTLAQSGAFVAFQYSLHMKGSFERIFEEVETRFVMMNIPPAFVYECRKVKQQEK